MSRRPVAAIDAALAGAETRAFWLDSDARPETRSPLRGDATVDLLIVGGGLTGLWAALQAAEGDGWSSVMLLEGERLAQGASGRNGGFCEASLTHGLANGVARWPDEIEKLEELGRGNLESIEATIRKHGIDCDWERTGTISVATKEYQVADLPEDVEMLRRYGAEAEVLDAAAVQAEVSSPTYLGAVAHHRDSALINPAKLCWELADAGERLGVTIHERTPVLSLHDQGDHVVVQTAGGRVRCRRVFLATSSFPPLVRAIRRYVVPVYDYVLVTEPLTEGQRAAVGWHHRQGVSDRGNQFHYYRLTPDNRILWGGYDAIYYFGNDMGIQREQRPATYRRLAEHFFTTFPQLDDIHFSHRWGGAIDTCSRFCVTFGQQMGDKVAYAVGFTGLGVGASRFAARVSLDLLAGRNTELTRLKMVREKPLPFPPEPLRYLGIQLTRAELARADRSEGQRGLWLQALDALGMGYDS